jgi:restriction endonuclease-like protein
MSYIDDPRNADWPKIAQRAKEFAQWTAAGVERECAEPYAAYAGEVRTRHLAYFAARPQERSPTQAWSSARRQDVFPSGWAHLTGALPESAWHKHHLSASSSQVLALALVSAVRSGTDWLPNGPFPGPAAVVFEAELAPDVLNEHPRQTSIDVVLASRERLVVVEAKFTERGFGTCSCERRDEGVCSSRVESRPYWAVAERELGLRRSERGCALGLGYQAVRNLAAASALAGWRQPEFLLLFDARNPYFAGAGIWPGWVDVLTNLAAYSTVAVSALSWQELLARAEVDRAVADWASEKHGLVAADAA